MVYKKAHWLCLKVEADSYLSKESVKCLIEIVAHVDRIGQLLR